tara:strand:- start:459 stop:980 length:522 start_codon:yes stop_codon:yes gene_type:complete
MYIIDRKKINFNTVSAIIFIAIGIFLYIVIPSQIDKPLIQLAIGQFNLPPELFPKIMAVSMIILGSWFFYKSFFIVQVNELKNLDKEAITNVIVTLTMMAIYVPLMVGLGFVVGSAIMILAMSTYFGNRNYIFGVLISIILPMLIFVVFRRVLLVELPPFPVDIYPFTNWSLI